MIDVTDEADLPDQIWTEEKVPETLPCDGRYPTTISKLQEFQSWQRTIPIHVDKDQGQLAVR